ncbi:MAG TPA: SagB/ThcOx family dehydrogenase [Candidatus Binataceae bacterium]|nr:SagB/ThcOx family dehydrogenase [Candidatus Binataceae bacterium]
MTNRDIDAALTFHELTKHSYTSVRSNPHILDWANRPMPYKIYPGAGTLALPRDFSLSPTSTLDTLRGRATSSTEEEFSLERLTRLLFCADGLTRRASVDGMDYHFRAAPSAGALYPVELYLAAGEIEGMERGLYHFLTADLKLHGLRRGDWRPYLARCCAMSETIREARAVLVMTTIFWRSAWKYRARAYRYCFWDTGTMLANLLATANAESLDATVISAFEDAPIEELLRVEGQREAIACIVALGRHSGPTAESPEVRPLELESIPLSPNEVVYDDLVKIHRASCLTTSAEVAELTNAQLETAEYRSAGAPVVLEPLEAEASLGLGETILRRGSTRNFAREAIASEELATILESPRSQTKPDFPGICETYLIVNAVEGLAAGAYYYDRERGSLELLRAGEFRREAGYLCLEQPLGMDCSALIVYTGDLARTLGAFGNRGYRYAHLEAGLLGGRAYLAAYSLGRGASGLTFYDDDTTRFFQPHCGGNSPLLMVAVGVPRPRRSQSDDR